MYGLTWAVLVLLAPCAAHSLMNVLMWVVLINVGGACACGALCRSLTYVRIDVGGADIYIVYWNSDRTD